MQQKTIALIGAGNMGRALIQGLIQSGYPANKLYVSDPRADQLEYLSSQYGINVSADNSSAASHADMLILATKPQQIQQALGELKDIVSQRQILILSIAAGVRIAAIKQCLTANAVVVRCMPNTPALLQAGISALFAPADVSKASCSTVESVINAVGTSLWLEKEDQMDAVTALSGSGPAYFFYIMESLIKAGTNLGLSAAQARQLCLQTASGAVKMALTDDQQDLSALRQRVTSPGGTTEAALKVMRSQGLDSLLVKALSAAHRRSIELAEHYGDCV